MKKANKLKDDARRFELREDWDKAIQAYQRVLEMGETEGDVELPLYNRIGDLYVRVGRPNDAVRYYSQAADRYADAGLFNNAIALCNKALRYAPENLDLLRKLGQFSASQGFLTDARRWFLDYAESAARQGRAEEALQALEDFANSTDDAEVRELFGRTMQQHGRHEQAVSELRHAYRLYLGAGESTRAEALATYLREIAPDVSLADEQPETRAARQQEDADYVIRPYGAGDTTTAADAQGAAAGPAPASEPVAEADAAGPEPPVESAQYADRSADEQDVPEGGTLEGLVGTAIGEHADVTETDVLEGFQPTSFETAPEDETDAFELPSIETAGATELDAEDVAFELPGLEPTALGEESETDGAVAEAPDVEDEDGDVYVELPTLDDEADVSIADDAEVPALELPTIEESDAAPLEEDEDVEAFELPTLDAADAADAADAEPEGADFELPAIDDADPAIGAVGDGHVGDGRLPALEEAGDLEESPAAEGEGDASFVVDEIELPTFGDAQELDPTPVAEDAHAGDDAQSIAAADEDEPALEDTTDDVSDGAQDVRDVAFAEPLLATDGESTADAGGSPAVRIDRSGEAIDRVMVAARGAVDRDDVAGAVGRLLSLHQELDHEAAYARAAEEVGGLLVEKPAEIRLHQVHVEFAERSGDRTLRLGAYLSLAGALEASGSLAKASAIYEHVLEIEPGHAAARQALESIERKRTPQYVDLKSLLDLDTPSGETRYFVSEDNPTGDEDNDFAAVLSQFKAKLAEHVSPEDAEAHYDLGLAFKEMGLLDEAVEQFQVALRTGDGRLRVYEELGDCFVQKGEYSVAVKLLERALQLPAADEMDRVGLYYYLGAASERLGRTDQARDAYERVLGLDMTFRDVAERLARL